MNSSLNILPLTAERYQTWNQLAEASDDAWFWHTTDWMEYSQAMAPHRFVDNLSFFICEGSEPAAICPVLMEQENGVRTFSYASGPIPSLALTGHLGAVKRERVHRLYVDTLKSLAAKQEVAYVKVKVPPLARSYLNSRMPFGNPFLRYGFFDVSELTQVIELGAPQTVLWAHVRKGHQADIKRAAKTCRAVFWDQSTITEEKFREYQALHFKDAGRMTRSQRTFDLMLSWVRQGHAVLVEATHDGSPVAFGLLMLFGARAYYGSSCKDPQFQEIPATHFIQWESILWLKDHAFDFYDIGFQHFCPLWFYVPSEKEINISKFKRGFGGWSIPVLMAEYYFSPAYFEQTFGHRMQSYLSSRAEAVVA